MKKCTLLLTMCIVLGFYACKKDNVTINSGKLIGKWHQTKLNLRQTIGNTFIKDTTFAGDNFTDLDFYQFNSDKTAVISKSGNFTFEGKYIILNADRLFDFVTHYTYSVADSTVAMKVTGIPAQIKANSNGLPFDQSPTIIQLDNSHLILRNVYDYNYSTSPSAVAAKVSLITTSYFTKE